MPVIVGQLKQNLRTLCVYMKCYERIVQEGIYNMRSWQQLPGFSQGCYSTAVLALSLNPGIATMNSKGKL